MITVNYGKILENIIQHNTESGLRPKLLIHACCAPCSSYVLEYLNEHFDITILFYNPNINSLEEFDFRYLELVRLIEEIPLGYEIHCEKIDFNKSEFYNAIKGFEKSPEGGERCYKCYELRLRKTAEYAYKNGFELFTTTLTISPMKNAGKLNEIGQLVSKETNVEFLPSDFKKKNGYKRSIELSRQFGLYRQNYCGCVYSYQESLTRNK